MPSSSSRSNCIELIWGSIRIFINLLVPNFLNSIAVNFLSWLAFFQMFQQAQSIVVQYQICEFLDLLFCLELFI